MLTINDGGQTATYFYQNRAQLIRDNAKSATICINSLVTKMKGFGIKVTDNEVATILEHPDGMSKVVYAFFDGYIKSQSWMPEIEVETKCKPFHQLVNFAVDSRRELFRHINECRGLRFIYNEEGTWIQADGLEAYILDTCTTPVTEAQLSLINFTADVAGYMDRGYYPQDFVCTTEAGNLTPDIERILGKIN